MIIYSTQTSEAIQKVHLTYCPLCGSDAEELTIGEVLKYYKKSGELLGYGHPGGIFSQALIECGVTYDTTTLDVDERTPAGEPCFDCVDDIIQQREEFKEEVEKGGIHWYCEVCSMWGVIVHNDSHGFAAAARQRAGIEPPISMGIKFKNCRHHESEEDPSDIIH